MPTDLRYNLTELADVAGVTPRTVRYYIAQGLLPSPGTVGPGAKYDDLHLARLRLIRQLQREHQPLAEIRRQLEALGDDQVLALAETPPTGPGDSALDYVRRLLAPQRKVSEPAYLYAAAPASAPASSPIAPTEPAVPAPDAPTEAQLTRSHWERVALSPDVELHIRRPLSRSTAKRVDRLVSIARDLLEEDLT